MLSNKQAKLIRSLHKKKHRDISGLYVVEGDKIVREYIEAGEEIILLAGKPEWISTLPVHQLKNIRDVVELSFKELKKVSSLTTPHNSLAIIKTKKKDLSDALLKGKITLALDFIQDPGNLGTIIRTAAWFGIENIICSRNCVDVYNPKVIQATMGAVSRVSVYYTDIEELLSESPMQEKTIYGTFLKGESVYGITLDSDSLFLFGNESHGLSKKYDPYITRRISIPSFSQGSRGSESLNVASAVAVFCSEISRV